MHRVFALALAVAVVAACGSASKPQVQLGPAYSTVPCPDNCGGDAECMAKCQDTSRSAPMQTPGH